jgi:hypothetical protein
MKPFGPALASDAAFLKKTGIKTSLLAATKPQKKIQIPTLQIVTILFESVVQAELNPLFSRHIVLVLVAENRINNAIAAKKFPPNWFETK